jgi:hypothetical protein
MPRAPPPQQCDHDGDDDHVEEAGSQPRGVQPMDEVFQPVRQQHGGHAGNVRKAGDGET